MIPVHKSCSHCDKVNDLVWIPSDMLKVSFKCPVCSIGTISYYDGNRVKEQKHG